MRHLVHQKSRVYKDMRRVTKYLFTPPPDGQTAMDKSITHASGDFCFSVPCLTNVVAEYFEPLSVQLAHPTFEWNFPV